MRRGISKSLLSGALALSLGLSAVGCVGSAETRRGGPTAAYKGPVIGFHEELGPAVVGRGALQEDGSVELAWPGAGVTLHFSGATVSVEMTDNGANQYLVIVDGKPKREKITPVAGRSTVPVVVGLPRGEHTVTLLRLNEPLVGTSTVHGFIIEEFAEVLPAAEPTSGLLVIGDSISAGYGNEGDNENCSFSPETENHYRSYGARAARELGVDLSTIAWSGKGVFSNRGSKQDTVAMPALWKKTLPVEGADYDFSGPAPRAVVINLGTNDFAPEVEDTSPFAAAYEALFDDVRGHYPKAHIFVSVGPLLSNEYPPGKQALDTVRSTLSQLVERKLAAGDDLVHLLEFAQVKPSEGWGCDFHPSIKTHDRMAAELLFALKESGAF